MSKHVEVVPYNPKWPEMFVWEAQLIKDALKENCIEVHHVGSTSVQGLAAKPKIDIIAIVKDASIINSGLESVGYIVKGEFNIPFHCGFAKREPPSQVNLHVFEEGNPEIDLNLLFRDYLRNHPDALQEYAHLKYNLVSDASSQEKSDLLFRGYTLGKDEFIKKILMKSGFKGLCIRFCTHYHEIEAAKKFRRQFLDEREDSNDSYKWAFDKKEDVHFIFYQGVEIIGYAYIQFLQNQKAALPIFVIDEPYQYQGLESYFLGLCEGWLKKQGYTLD